MNYEKLMELLKNIDKKTPEIIRTTTSETEKIMALNALYLMKLEQIDDYITENCYDSNISRAFRMFSDISVQAIGDLQKLQKMNREQVNNA